LGTERQNDNSSGIQYSVAPATKILIGFIIWAAYEGVQYGAKSKADTFYKSVYWKSWDEV
jgi:hypothetical protein